jgi:hypothetical protein
MGWVLPGFVTGGAITALLLFYHFKRERHNRGDRQRRRWQREYDE